MELSELNNFRLDKNRLHFYYNKYQYKISLRLVGIEYFRYINNILAFNERLNSVISRFDYRFVSAKHFELPTLAEVLHARTNFNKFAVEEFIDWKCSRTERDDHTIKISHGTVDCYSSNLDIIKFLEDIAVRNNVSHELYYVENNSYERNVIYRKNPKNLYRVYLSFRRMEEKERDKFLKIINDHGFITSRSLNETLTNSSRNSIQRFIFGQANPTYYLLFDHHYLDFDDDRLITILSLTYPDLIRKICRMEKR